MENTFKEELIKFITWVDEGYNFGESGELIVNDYLKQESQQCNLYAVSYSIAQEYAEFCVRCDRDGLPLLNIEDYIKQYCC